MAASARKLIVRKDSRPASGLFFLLLVVLVAACPVSSARPAPNFHARSGFVTSWDGTQIHYLEAGKSRSTATSPDVSLLFVPGFTMPAWIWEDQIAHFSVRHHVVAMDLRSQGESSKASDGHYPASQARDIKAVIDHLHLAPVVIVGWSMAVTETISYVDQFGTSSLAGIVLVDGLAGRDLTPELVKSNVDFLAAMQTNRAQVTSDFVHSIFHKPHAEEYLRRLTNASMAIPADAVLAMGLSDFYTDNRPALPKIDKPTLIVGSTRRLLPQFQAMQARLPQAQLEFFEDAGHALFVDDSEKFNALLDDFLAGLKK